MPNAIQSGSFLSWSRKQIASDKKSPTHFAKAALASLLVWTLFVSLVLSASPALHEQVHSDAAQASHQCAITVLQQQHLLASSPNVILIDRDWKDLPSIAIPVCSPVSDYDYSFSASRAPPFSLIPLA